MQKKFNVNGKCYPDKHYMVDITERLSKIQIMVDEGDYFCINRGRQYGKTTTLALLKKRLELEYMVFSISFEGIGEEPFSTEQKFVKSFLTLLNECVEYKEVNHLNDYVKDLILEALKSENLDYLKLSAFISKLCKSADQPVVLLIDEVDQAGNFSSFVKFLGVLRDKYLNKEERPTFQSVILAAVYDIKNLKMKMRPVEAHQYNSPWNIAADFDVDMSLSQDGIELMLKEYEQEHKTGMKTGVMAELLYSYTSGYPFLVSRLCKIMDEILPKKGMDKKIIWTRDGFQSALKILLSESSTLFDDMIKKLTDFPEMKQMLYGILYKGQSFAYNQYQQSNGIAGSFGYIKNEHGRIAVANRIFEIWLYNLFVSEEQVQSAIYAEGSKDKKLFEKNGNLDMEHLLERFVVHFTDLYGKQNDKFVEEFGRKYFLFYLKPIINGTGNYYIESRTRDEGRTDVIVDYLGKQYIIELKIWHGNAYHERGEKQLIEYLEAYHLKKGYMLSFNFNKNKNVGVTRFTIGDKEIIEAIV